MANAKSKPKARKKLITKERFLIGVGIILLVVAGGVGYKVYQHRQQQNKQFKVDQANFKEAEASMATAYAAVVQQIGQPYETKIDKSCGYAHLKLTRGRLSCGIVYRFNYQISDRALNIPTAVEIYDVIVGTNGYSQNKFDNPLRELDDAQEPDAFMTNIDGPNNFSCSVNYQTADINLYNSQKQTLHFSKNLATSLMAEYSFGCGSGAAKPVYELTND